MNRSLLVGLAVVGALSLYLMTSQADDELLAPGKQSGHTQQGSASAEADASSHQKARKDTDAGGRSSEQVAAMEPWVADALTQGVRGWQARVAQGASAQHGDLALAAWGGTRPPPPPAQRQVALTDMQPPPPPPPPMAPRFPHEWVGRFNDEPVAVAASGASAATKAGVQRAVVAGPLTTWVVRVGDVIEGQWRVDQIQDRTMSLTYLPLKQQQTIAMR